LQPPANFKYKFFGGALVLEIFNLASSSFGNVVFTQQHIMGFFIGQRDDVTTIVTTNHKNQYVVPKAIEMSCEVMVLQL
jgi:hypothetical protein